MAIQEIAHKVKAWKESGYEVYLVHLQIAGVSTPFVVRALTKKEYESLIEGLNPSVYFPTTSTSPDWPYQYLTLYGTLQYEDVIRAGLLWPSLSDSMPAGIDAQLAKIITIVSGWASKSRFVDQLNAARQKSSTIWGFLESRIRTAFPYLTDLHMHDMTLEQFVDKAAMSELITGVPIDPQPWVDPAGYLARLEKEQKVAKRMAAQRGEQQLDTAHVRDPRMRDELRKAQLAAMAENIPVDLQDPNTKVNFDKDNRGIASV